MSEAAFDGRSEARAGGGRSITVTEAYLEAGAPDPEEGSRTGYGRDADEARAHAGWDEGSGNGKKYRSVEVSDEPGGAAGSASERVAWHVCRYHLEADVDLPQSVCRQLKEMLDKRLFATALQYCFETIWDGMYD